MYYFVTDFYNPQQLSIQRPGPTQPVATGPQNQTQPPPQNIPLVQNTQQHPAPRVNKRRSHAIAVIDPVTGKYAVSFFFLVFVELSVAIWYVFISISKTKKYLNGV